MVFDYDFYVVGIVLSVCFVVDVLENFKDSFYNGIVYVIVKEKVFELLFFLRYSIEIIFIVWKYFLYNDVDMEKFILLRIIDGGFDYSIMYRFV